MAHEIQTAIGAIIGGIILNSAGIAGDPRRSRDGASVDTRGLWADFLSCLLVLIA